MNFITKRNFSHLTPPYIFNRILVKINQWQYKENPWITSSASRILDSLLISSDIGVEFGSGRSTLWFAQRLKHLISIEKKPEWYFKVKKNLSISKLEPRVELRLCPDDNDYVSQALTFDDNSVDFCLIDGAKRDYCALYMLPKLRKGGILVLDNANLFLPNDSTYSPNSRRMKEGFSTETWQQFAEQASKFRRIWTSNGVWDTVIWIKC